MYKRAFQISIKTKFLFVLMLMTFLSACVSTRNDNIPIHDIPIAEPLPKSGRHKVLVNETLYSIAWRYGLDYRYLAGLNHIAPPYTIRKGQIIYLKPKKTIKNKILSKKQIEPLIIEAKDHTLPNNSHLPQKKNKVVKATHLPKTIVTAAVKEPSGRVTQWLWPASGPIQSKYSNLNKGINISGKLGDPVYATATGKVVYSGNGLRRYGNLIIIKHNSTFLTAYAHNNRLFVHEGEWVKAGQKIAEMGHTDTKMVELHFEIRRNGQPVNPLFYLAKKTD